MESPASEVAVHHVERGVGRTPAPAHLAGAEDVLQVLLDFAAAVHEGTPYLLVGHSAGGSFAQANASLAVVDDAGHARPHERPELLRALVTEWRARVGDAD